MRGWGKGGDYSRLFNKLVVSGRPVLFNPVFLMFTAKDGDGGLRCGLPTQLKPYMGTKQARFFATLRMTGRDACPTNQNDIV
jgi:hypothetical protein